MNSVLVREYNETSAKAAYLQKIADKAETQDLSEDFGPTTVRLGIVFTSIALFFVALRFLARWKFRVRVGWDDWLILASAVLLIVNTAMNGVIVHLGLGRHAGALTLEQRQRLDKVLVGSEVLYASNVSLFKFSLLCLYVRLFPLRTVRVGSYIFGSIAGVWTIACIMISAFQCNPRNKLWEPWTQGACMNMFLAFLGVSVPNILCDMGILCLPIPQVWKLQTNRREKFFFSGIFLLGSCVVFTSAYRFRIYLEYDPDDVPYTLADGALWNIIEITSGTVSACLPTLGPLINSAIKPVIEPLRNHRRHFESTIAVIRTFGQGDRGNSRRRRDPDASLFFTGTGDEESKLDTRQNSGATLHDDPHGCEVPLTTKGDEKVSVLHTELARIPTIHVHSPTEQCV